MPIITLAELGAELSGPVGARVPCNFEDSNGTCHGLSPRGICGAPSSGAAALVQHANAARLCALDPPYGFRPLCLERGADGALAMLRGLRDPARCHYRSCAVVGASGNLLGARLGAAIDGHDAVIRVNFAPDGPMARFSKAAPHQHRPTWVADVGSRTSWRVLTMEGYGYLAHYSRFWLKPPFGHGTHGNMSGVPQAPLLAISCHTPGTSMGRCRADRLAQNFAHPESASYLINPELLRETRDAYFKGARPRPAGGAKASPVPPRPLTGRRRTRGILQRPCRRWRAPEKPRSTVSTTIPRRRNPNNEPTTTPLPTGPHDRSLRPPTSPQA